MTKNTKAVAISIRDLHMREAREQIHVLRILKGSKTFKDPEHCLEPSKATENTPEVTATNTHPQVPKNPVSSAKAGYLYFNQQRLGGKV